MQNTRKLFNLQSNWKEKSMAVTFQAFPFHSQLYRITRNIPNSWLVRVTFDTNNCNCLQLRSGHNFLITSYVIFSYPCTLYWNSSKFRVVNNSKYLSSHVHHHESVCLKILQILHVSHLCNFNTSRKVELLPHVLTTKS
jgi:hypothetical protein